MTSDSSLTNHLATLATTPISYAAATQHPFLTSAGNGSLPGSRLALWLSQDRIYAAHAYPRFIGLLIAQIPFSSSDALDSVREKQNQKILKVLVFALDNIVQEAAFFKETSQKWDLDIERWPERKATRDYTAEMARVSGSRSLADGLIFLWAMERVYLDAWKYVKSLMSQNDTCAVSSFVTNWTSPEFEKFVDELAELVDELGIQPGSDGWKRGEDIWTRIIELEEAFWPNEGEESD
ncbi:heme oxygenase-like protein, partial [Athelia psychrophila]